MQRAERSSSVNRLRLRSVRSLAPPKPVQPKRAPVEAAPHPAPPTAGAVQFHAAPLPAGPPPASAPASAAGGGRDDDVADVRAAIEAQRRCLVALRADGTIGDAAFQRVEEELDWTELGWAQVVR